MSSEAEDKNLKMVGLELMFLTPEKYSHKDGITAVELAKLVNLPLDEVKKKLQILKDKNIVRVKGINPKYWLFDEYNFQRLDDDDDIFICSATLRTLILTDILHTDGVIL